ncbi:uncharacterized protein LOC123222913 isoform X1 [Mangifera indica]|uniref:uncharacterized protein LOC123222913 isoform X1 n=1 Tax=Mangifera indica TaxID=29780 RepID=UPI001CFA5F5A|nr:uncharacterized protein LOC123222913 isoform X1 [Mangifera indica]XP_044501874.1 uncharacterized protein LOC123222913 isoform X1 [Mangifera indica]
MEYEEWNRRFIDWFKTKVATLQKHDNRKIVEELVSLSRGPSQSVCCFNGYVVNGYKFRVECHDEGFRTQNCGVVMTADIGSEMGNIDYSGILTEIIELQYLGGRKVVLFRCKWFDVHDNEMGAKVDEYGLTSINCNRLLKTNEPFVLAYQVSQVFYAIDNINKAWQVVLKTHPRDSYDLPLQMDDNCDEMDNVSETYQ